MSGEPRGPLQDMEKLPRDQLCRELAAKQALGFGPEHVGGSAGGHDGWCLAAMEGLLA